MNNESSCLIHRRASSRGDFNRRRGGQVLILTLLGLTLLAGLIFYVYNIGYVMNRRLDLQSTSDAVAISGAGWMARSMNVVAMDNVGMSRNLAAVVVLDSLPLATEMSLDEVNESLQGLTAQLTRGLPNDAGGQYLQQGLNTLQQRLTAEQSILNSVDQTLNHSGFDIADVTHWAVRGANGPQPQGTLWQSVVAMDNLSQATVASAGIVAQADAVAFAHTEHVPTASAFLTPILPVIPARRTTFNDFQPTLMGVEKVENESATMQHNGGNGGAIPDMEYPHRLGPWARLYWDGNTSFRRGWREPIWTGGTSRQGTWVPTQQVRPPAGVPSIAGASAVSRSAGYWVGGQATRGELAGYRTYGPYNWMLRRISNWADDNRSVAGRGQLPDTTFTRHIGDLSRVKLNYMFPAGLNKPPKTYHYPLWVTDYPEAKAMATTPNVRVITTMYYVVEIASSIPEGGANYLGAGTFRTNGDRPINAQYKNWYDVGAQTALKAVKVGDYVWKANFTYQVTNDPGLGIATKLDDNGNPIWQDAYLIRWYVFGGIDVGGDVQISNPANWDTLEGLPAPMLLDTSDGDYDPVTQDPDAGFRRDRFTYLGAAYNPTTAKLYPTWFNTGVSAPMVAFSQAKVFNNNSWDLWTQDWQVQLAPVSKLVPPDLGNWQQKIADGMNDYSAVRDWVDIRDIQTIQNYLSQFDKNTTSLYVNH